MDLEPASQTDRAATDVHLSADEVIARMHQGDPMARALSIVLVEATDDRVVLQMAVDDRHLGGHELCHGGVLFTLADVALSYVSNRSNDQAVATSADIDFIAAVRRGDVVEAIGVEAHHRGRMAICDVELSVGSTTVALFRGTTLRTGGRVTDIY